MFYIRVFIDDCFVVSSVAGEMEKLFVKQSSLEVYFEWLDSLIDKRVHEVCVCVCSCILKTFCISCCIAC